MNNTTMNKIILILIALSLIAMPAHAIPWGNETWLKKAPILLNNTGNATVLTNYQVNLNITYDSDMNANFSDIRVVNDTSGTAVSHWIESKVDSFYANVWFNASSIPASVWTNSTYYLYYGNPSAASASNGTNTFMFFDDFAGSSLSSAWTLSGSPNVAVSGGIFTWTPVAAYSSVYNDVLRTVPYAVRTKANVKTPPSSSDSLTMIRMSDNPATAVPTNLFTIGLTHLTTGNYRWWATASGATAYADAGNIAMDNSYHTFESKIKTGEITNYIDDKLQVTDTTDIPSSAMKLEISGQPSAGQILVDWVLVRKYASPEPTGQVGAVQLPIFIPPNITALAQTNSSIGYWINYTWQNGTENTNITNSFNVSVNGTWTNGSITNFSNGTVVPHGWRNISVWAFNSSAGNLSNASVSMNTQIPSNAPVQSSIGAKSGNENSWLNFSISSTDADGDTLTYATNATKGTLSGYNFSWKPNLADTGTYNWIFNTTDNYSAVATETITVTVNNIDFIPPTPIIETVTTGNFYVNTTWSAGSGNITNGYNSTNGTTWINNTNTYRNTTLSAHAWQNLTVYAFNSSYGNLSLTALTNNTQIPNNLPTLSVGNQTVSEGQTVFIQLNSTDVDSDVLTYSINRTDLFTDFNSTTGRGNWTTNYSSSGIYYIDAGVDDGYDGIVNYTFNITVNNTSPIPVTACGTLNIDGETYNLIQNVSSAGTCFVIGAHNLTLDGQGYTVKYSQSSVGYGINNLAGYDNITIKNLNIVLNSTISNAVAIYGIGMLNSTITNNTITTPGLYGYGIYLESSSNSNILYNNTITASGTYGYGIVLESSSNSNNISNNKITTLGAHGYGVTLYLSNNLNNVSDNNITISGTAGYSYGIYVYSSSNLNNVSNNNITISGTAGDGIYVYSSNSNNFVNNNVTTFGTYSYGIFIDSSNSNIIKNGSIISKLSYDYFLRGASTANNFINTNWTAQRRIYFNDTTSWFNYNNESDGNIWLKNNVSAATGVNRTLIKWSKSNMTWQDSATVTAYYKLTGLLPDTVYNVFNNSINSYSLTTDSAGNLPQFSIALNGNTEIKVVVPPPEPTANLNYNINNIIYGYNTTYNVLSYKIILNKIPTNITYIPNYIIVNDNNILSNFQQQNGTLNYKLILNNKINDDIRTTNNYIYFSSKNILYVVDKNNGTILSKVIT